VRRLSELDQQWSKSELSTDLSTENVERYESRWSYSSIREPRYLFCARAPGSYGMTWRSDSGRGSRRRSMTRWLAHSVILAVVMSMIGCVSTPQPPPQTLGFTRASQVEGSETVWIMEDDGSDPLPLDLGADGNRSVTWSPDGNDIAFVSVRDGNAERSTRRDFFPLAMVALLRRTFNEGRIPRLTTDFPHGLRIAPCLRLRPTEPTRTPLTSISSI